MFASLTTREPPYHENLISTLNSLSGHFNKIYLTLPKVSKNGIKYTIPENLPSDVEIVWLEKDYGPVCKILGGLKKQKKGILITFDDDFNYNTKDIIISETNTVLLDMSRKRRMLLKQRPLLYRCYRFCLYKVPTCNQSFRGPPSCGEFNFR